ncbi:MAG: RNA-binding protein [Pseudomonadota bacterium]
MARGGRKSERDGPERRCIVTGDSGETGGLIRFVVGPDGAVVPDLAERLPGRGIWVSATREALGMAAKKKLFSRSAKMQVTVPEGLVEQVEGLLVKRLIELLGLARKAGLVTAGFTNTEARLRQGAVAALIEARDGSPRQLSKLRPLAGQSPVLGQLFGSELGVAFGRDHVIHGALNAGGVTERVLRESARLEGFRPSGGLEHPDAAVENGTKESGADAGLER